MRPETSISFCKNRKEGERTVTEIVHLPYLTSACAAARIGPSGSTPNSSDGLRALCSASTSAILAADTFLCGTAFVQSPHSFLWCSSSFANLES